MTRYTIRKKPSDVEAVLLENNMTSILNALDFIGSENCSAGYIREIQAQGHIKFKTPESHGETQNADFGDWILKAWSTKLGTHFYPVKPDYIQDHYDVVKEETRDHFAEAVAEA